MSKLLNRCSVPALIFALILITLLIFSWPLFLIRLVRAEPDRNGQVDSEILNVELQTAIVSSLDFDRNGIVDSHDFRAFVNHFGTQDEDEKYNAKYDINGNETVDFADFLIFAKNYGKVVNHTPTAISAHPVKVLGDKNIVSGQELVKNQQTGAVDGESSVHIEIAIKESGRILTLSDTLKFAFGTAMPDVLVTVSGGTPHYDQMGIANFPRGIRMDDFHYDSTTGKTMMTVVGIPEKVGVFKIEIDVVDGEQYYMSYFHISVEPVTDMDMPPVFPKNSVVLSFTLDPSTLDPSIILEIDPPVRAYDPNDDKLNYSLMGDDASNFTVNWFGHIKTKAGAVFNKEVYTFTIVVDDSNGGVATAEVTINIIHPLTPDKPIFARVKPIGTVFVEITWRAPPANDYVIIGYEIQYRKVDEDYNTIIPVNFTRSDMSYTVVGLGRSTTYEFQVRTVFEGGKSNWSPAIRATTGHNTPPVFTSVSAVTFNENSTADIVTVTATDANADDNITGYHIVEGADGSQFEIVQAVGVLSFKVAPNYEAPADVAFKDVSNSTNNNAGENNEYIVVMEVKSGTGGRELTGRDTLTVTVEDVNEAPGVPDAPTVASSTFNSLTVEWEAPTNTGPAISAYDVRHILTSEDETDDANWTVKEDAWKSSDGGSLEYTISLLSQNTSYDVQVRAESDEGTGDWSDAVVEMTQANEAPVITSASAFSVNENSTADIATVSATDRDADDDIESYGIVDDADGSQFEIDDQSGVLTFNTVPNYEDPVDVAVTDLANAAENNEYIVIVEATSGTGDRALTAGDTLTVTVEDVNEAPGVPDTPTVSASTFNNLTVSWTAPTNTGPEISAYDVRHILSSATDKADANWVVTEDVWTSVNGGYLEYTIGSLVQNTSYDVQVRAKNDEGTSGWSDTVAGTTEANVAPVFTSVSAVTFSENSTGDVVTVSATDADENDSIIEYGIVEVGDGAQFDLNDQTGVLSFKVAPNYEAPTDVAFEDISNSANNNAGENNEYIVVVEVKSGTDARELMVRDTLTVTVSDVDEAPGVPDAPTVASSTFNSLTVEWEAPTNMGPAISAYDVRHILTSEDETDDTNWAVKEEAWKSGDGNLEYLIGGLSQNTSYDIQVRAESDEGTSDWSSSVSGTTSANVTPVIATISPISVAENSTGDVVTVSATDADEGDDIESYGIASGADGELFSIGASTGVLTFKVFPNYEDPKDVAVSDPANDASNNEYIVYVTATGGTGARALTARDTLTITVSDVTEVPGKPATPTIAEVTFNSLIVEWTAPANTGPAISAYDVRYILSSVSATDKEDDSKWTVVEDAWASTNGGNLEYTITDLDQNTIYDVQIRANNDEGMSGWSPSVAEMTQQNQAPVFTSASAISVSENSAAAIVTVTAADADTDDEITEYAITGGVDQALFAFDAQTRVLTFTTAPDYERPGDDDTNSEYIVEVTATSGADARELTATQTITVTVTDVDTEVPGVPDVPTVVSSTFNSLTVEWNAPENTGPEITAYDVRYILASEDETDDANWIVVEDAWETDGGDLSYTIGSLSPNTSYEVQVRAESDEGISDWSDAVSGTTLVTVPGAPTDLIATSGFLVTLSWIAPADEGGSPITRYEYRASDDDGTTWDPNWTTTGGTATTYTVGDLTFDTEYTFEVRAVNVVGNSLVSNQATATPKRRRPPFSRGVNLTVFMQRPRTHPFITYDRQTFVNVKTLGCDVVRLPFVPLTSGGPSHIIDPLFFTYLDQIVDWAEELGLYIILDNHTNHKLAAEETDQNNRSDTREYLVQVWPQIAERYKNRSKLVLYEVFNEPNIQPSIWNPIQQAVIDTIRVHDDTHTIVVTGGMFHQGALRTLPEYTDDNLIYTFHIYNPGEFTHQGAGWIDRFKDLRGVPWPYDASRMPDPVPEILEDYHTKGTLEKLQNGLKNAVDFAEDRNVPVWCGEFGVYGLYAPPDDRAAWIREARTYMEDNNIAWTLWEYGVGGFKIFENEGDDHFDYNLDISIVEALGLNVPPQLEWVIVSKQAGFEIYTDGLNSLGEGISGKLYSRGWLTFDDDTEAVVGNKSIYWSGAKKSDIVRFDFTPNFDLSLLVGDYVFEFWVWGDTPGTEFRVRFDMDSNRGYRVNEENIGITSWDSQWHQVSIPLSRLGRSNATWEDVDGIIFTTTEDFGDTIFRLDDIKITTNVAPVITSISPITVNENTTSALVTVSAIDTDDDITGYGIVSDADGAQFEITNAGVLTFKNAPNYEDAQDVQFEDPANPAYDSGAEDNEYIVIVEATSGADARELTSRDTLTVTVVDVDGEAPGVPDAPTVASSTFNSLMVEWEAPANTGPDISSYDIRYILTSEDETVNANWIEVTDAWMSNNGGNLEYTISSLAQDTSYDVQVRAENAEGTSDWSDAIVGMTEIAPGICTRTAAVQTEILSAIAGITDCALVTNMHLTGITEILDLSNQNITALLANDFTGLSNLQNLWLYENDLRTLPADVFTDLSSLRTLSLYRNKFRTLPADVFTGLSSLQTLNLDGNRLNNLDANLFADLSSLQTLSLYDNRLTNLPIDVFSGLSSLQTLSLYDNRLTNLPMGVFSDLSSLQTLNLDNNRLTNLPIDVFSGLSSLQTLSLSGNTLSTLPDGAFSNLSNLKFLSLDDNELGTLPDRAFLGLSNLQTLNLGSNTLGALPDSAFFDLSSLQILNLKDNMLSTFPDSMFFGLSSLRKLDVSGNTGAPFTLTLELKRIDNADLTAQGPATVVISIAQGAPFDMTVELSAIDGTLTNGNGSAITVATISKGNIQSKSITVTQSGTSPTRIHIDDAPDAPGGYEGIRTVSGTALALFGKTEPEVVGAIAAQTLKVGGGAVVVDVKDSFSDVDGDILGYSATSNMPGIASVSVTGSMVTITPVSAGSATVTVTASDQTNSATQEIDVIVKNTAPVVDKGLTDQIALSGNAFTYTFPADAFSDADSDALTYTSSGQPAWLTFTPSSRMFSGTPSNTDGSPFTIIVTADDGKNSQVQTSFTLTIPIGICSRTSQVQTAILSVIDGINNCAHVTEEHLVGIVDSLDFRSRSITALLASDFSDMPNLRILNFYDNDLTSLPSGVFSGLSNLRFVSLYDNELTALPVDVFDGLSNLRFVSLDSNSVSTLPAGVFSGLSNLESLSLNGNMLSVLPTGVFSGLSSLSHLDVSGNTGAPFSLTLILERTDNTDLTATGPATVVVKVAQGAPFDMTVELSATDGTLTDENGNAITEVTISKGNIQSEPITVTQSGTTSTTVSLGTAPSLPMNYVGIQIAVGTSLILFGQ